MNANTRNAVSVSKTKTNDTFDTHTSVDQSIALSFDESTRLDGTWLANLDTNQKEKEIETWLRTTNDRELAQLFSQADQVRAAHVGTDVYLRGLIEISSHCRRRCLYCGLAANNSHLKRYRLTPEDIMESAARAVSYGFGTVVLQGGEDLSFTKEGVVDIIRRIKENFGLAITLSLGEREPEELAAWKEAGADRYLLRFETSDENLLRTIHPPLPRAPDRFELLAVLRQLNYEVGSGVMIGLPGQSFSTLARDIALFDELKLDMIGVGPFIPHPDTVLGKAGGLEIKAIPQLDVHDQVPATADMVYRVVALTRLLRPSANIPATTALGVTDEQEGRLRALQCGANVIMPNCTPARYRALYEIYPGKDCSSEAEEALSLLKSQIASIDRTTGTGPGRSPSFAEHIDRA